jgi:hypothetical protein
MIGNTEVDYSETVSSLSLTLSSLNFCNPIFICDFTNNKSFQEAIEIVNIADLDDIPKFSINKYEKAAQEHLRAIRLLITDIQLSERESEYIDQVLKNWSSTEIERLKSELIVTSLEEVIVKRPFNWQVEFPHVFDPRLPEDQKGFAAIIGNPPYFSVDATFGRGASELLWLKTIYADIYTDKTDILFYFLRWGYELLKEAGTLSFIVSRAFIQGDKSKNLREFLSQNTKITYLLDFLGHKVFNAGIATCIIQYQKQIPDDESNFVTDYVLDFDKAKSVIPEKIELSAQNGFAKVEVNQENLKSDRWEISPYSHIFSEIDLNTSDSFKK